MITKTDIKVHIIYWYRTAKENAELGLEKASLIAIGRGETYLAIAYQQNIITEERYRLLRNAYERLW